MQVVQSSQKDLWYKIKINKLFNHNNIHFQLSPIYQKNRIGFIVQLFHVTYSCINLNVKANEFFIGYKSLNYELDSTNKIVAKSYKICNNFYATDICLHNQLLRGKYISISNVQNKVFQVTWPPASNRYTNSNFDWLNNVQIQINWKWGNKEKVRNNYFKA